MEVALVILRVAASQHNLSPQQVGIPEGKIQISWRLVTRLWQPERGGPLRWWLSPEARQSPLPLCWAGSSQSLFQDSLAVAKQVSPERPGNKNRHGDSRGKWDASHNLWLSRYTGRGSKEGQGVELKHPVELRWALGDCVCVCMCVSG